MKLKNIMTYSIIGISLILSSCKQDNYPAPNAGIVGVITDAITNAPIQTEQPNGTKIRLIEERYGNKVTPIDFWGKADGSFENSNVFADKYKIIPIEGAFFPADTAEVTVNGLITVNFKVTPFLTITASVTPSTGSVTTSYKISRTKVGDKITTCKTLVSAYPAVSNVINEFNVSHDISGDTDLNILSNQYSDKITGLTSGNTYYVRVAASTNNANNKYNYSEVFTVKIP
jgi:hypothetical protein